MSAQIHAIAVPKWGIEMIEGTLNAWNRELGDEIGTGEEILELESDKIVNMLEAGGKGVLRRKLAEPGETLQVGELLGVIADASVEESEIDTFVANWQATESAKAGPAASKPAAPSPRPETPSRTAEHAQESTARVRVSPVVRRLAAELGVDLSQLKGSGRSGRITKEDVEAVAATGSTPDANPETEPASANPSTEAPMTGMRRTIARRMQSAKQTIPHFYLTVDLPLAGLQAMRARLNADEQARRVSVNDLLIWCIARALKAVPEVNVQCVDDDHVLQFEHADIAVGVATDRGLITPVVRAAQSKSPGEIAENMAELSAKAREGGLTMDEISGGTFTLSNLGMMDVREFTAIINPPQGAILAAGKSEHRVIVDDGEMRIAELMTVTLSCDHRVIDGAVAARFLQSLTHQVQQLG